VRVDGDLHWLHVLSTAELTVYFPHPKRTAEALDAFGLLEQFVGVLVYDHWSPFSKALVHIMAKQAGVPVREFCRLCKDKKLLVTGILIE